MNKVNTKAELRFSLKQAKWMPDWLKSRFINESSNKRYINSAGDIVIASDEHRSQKQNIEACIDKLYDAIQQSCMYVMIGCHDYIAIRLAFYFHIPGLILPRSMHIVVCLPISIRLLTLFPVTPSLFVVYQQRHLKNRKRK